MEKQLQQLRKNDCLPCEVGTVRIVSSENVGTGAQGEVYVVELNGKLYALKMFFDKGTKELRSNLRALIKNPVRSSSFAWPLYEVEYQDRYGYIMELVPKEYRTIAEWVGGRFDTTLDVLLKVCIRLSDAFQALHSKGYSYKDISFANVFFDPDCGDVKIIDNDNVTPNLKSTSVVGTNGFMAPELIAGYTSVPSRLTDLHSLAVLLFQLLTAEHPLHGKKEYHLSVCDTEETDFIKELYGPTTARFIFGDAKDLDRYIETDEPSHIAAKEQWLFLPPFLQKNFRRVFCEGLCAPHERPLSHEWARDFLSLLGMLYRCPHCGRTYLYDRDLFFNTHGEPPCRNCGTPIFTPRIKIGDNIVLLENGTVLYAGYFSASAKDKLRPVLTTELRNGHLRFRNLSDLPVEYRGYIAERDEYTDRITSSGTVRIGGTDYPIMM